MLFENLANIVYWVQKRCFWMIFFFLALFSIHQEGTYIEKGTRSLPPAVIIKAKTSTGNIHDNTLVSWNFIGLACELALIFVWPLSNVGLCSQSVKEKANCKKEKQ